MHSVAAVLVSLTMGVGCGYWKARPAGDTAPARWGDVSVGRDVPSAVSQATTRLEAPVPPGPQGVEERLRNLETLKRQDVIGHAEYRERRQDILREGFE